MGIIELVTRARQGDEAAYLELFGLYEEDLYRVAYVYLSNPEDALDAVQEMAYRSFKSIKSLKEPQYFKTWLIKIAMSCSTDMLRKRNMQMAFDLAGFPITITKTERLDDGHSLKFYVDMHYDENAAASLFHFGIDKQSFKGWSNERTGAYESIEFEIDPDDEYIELTFNNPVAVLRGPWTFEWSADDFKAAQ